MERICSIGKSLNIILNNNNNNKRTKQNWLGSLMNQNDQIWFYLFFKLLCWKPRRFSSNGTSSPKSHLCAKEAGPCLFFKGAKHIHFGRCWVWLLLLIERDNANFNLIRISLVSKSMPMLLIFFPFFSHFLGLIIDFYCWLCYRLL